MWPVFERSAPTLSPPPGRLAVANGGGVEGAGIGEVRFVWADSPVVEEGARPKMSANHMEENGLDEAGWEEAAVEESGEQEAGFGGTVPTGVRYWNHSLLGVPRLTSGRQVRVVRGMRARLDGGPVVLRVACDHALAELAQLRALESGWAGRKPVGRSGLSDTLASDRVVDGIIGRIYEAGEAAARIYGPSSPIGRAGSRLRTTLFPDGLAGHVNLDHLEQELRNEELLDALGSKDWAFEVAELRLAPLIEELQAAQASFVSALRAQERLRGDAPAWEEVRGARAAAHEHLCSVVIGVLWHLPPGLERDRVLEPLIQEIDNQRAVSRRRAQVPDVDPDTGDEVL